MRFRSASAALLIFAALLPGVARPEAGAAPALPEGLAPLPSGSAKHFQELIAAVEKYRGLAALRPVPAGTLEEPELRKKILESFRREVSPEEIEAIEIGAKAFGFIPESMDLSRYLPELLTSQVAGFYDPERDYMALVRRGGRGRRAEAEGIEDTVIVHELTHALQDQHFDLKRLAGVDPLSESATARSALTEGDATLTMTSFLVQGNVEALAGFGDTLKSFLADPDKLAGVAAGGPGGADFAKAPAWIRDAMLFSYVQGFAFCLDARRLGGQKLLDYAFSTDPPRSSEQILHPEKWHTRRDDPIVLRWPDLSAALPGWSRVSEGELGEATILTLLRESSPSREETAAAAAGWGGDRFAVYRKDGKRALVWWTEWDSDADAREFQAAARRLGSSWQVEAVSPRRVEVLRGDLTGEQRAAVRAGLAAAEAVSPANRTIDLKGLGAAP